MTFRKSELADLVHEQIHPVLKARGFVRRGLLFIRDLKEVWQLVGFQKSVESSHDTTSFTVNLGVSSKRILRFIGGPERPTVGDYHWKERLGFLGPQRDDIWWTVSSRSREPMVEVVALLMESGIPELDRLSSDIALRDLWLTGRSPGLTEPGRLVRSSPQTEGNRGITRVFSPRTWERGDIELACRSLYARVASRKSRRSLFPVYARRKSHFSDGKAS